MNANESRLQSARIEAYRRLEARMTDIRHLLEKMQEPKVLGSGPFTGNTRESRKVDVLLLTFSPTLGGACPVQLELKGLDLPAHPFGLWLVEQLKAQVDEIEAEMEKI